MRDPVNILSSKYRERREQQREYAVMTHLPCLLDVSPKLEAMQSALQPELEVAKLRHCDWTVG